MKIYNPGIAALSQLLIDAAKNWANFAITNLASIAFNDGTVQTTADRGQVIRKPADAQKWDSALSDDADLRFSVAANDRWEFVLVIRHQSSVNNFGLKYLFSVPAAAVIKVMTIQNATALTAEVDGTVQSDIWSEVVGTVYYTMLRYLYIGGANAGTVQFRWANEGGAGQHTDVLANSYIVAHKLS